MSAHNPLTMPDAVVAGDSLPATAVGPGFFRRVPPNLFASVMGTGIVATLAARFDWVSPVFREFGTTVWLLAAGWLLVLSAGLLGEWLVHRRAVMTRALGPAVLPFYGTVPMAVLTVGAGTLLYGPAMFGSASRWIAAALWVVGTVMGVITAIGVPIAAVRSADGDADRGLPSWILPVVPPMVSATTGAGLVSQIGSPTMRTGMQTLCYGLFGMALILALLTLAMIYHRLLRAGAPPAPATPTVWIPLGVIGQSIAAANLLALQDTSATAGDGLAGPLLRIIGIGFGVTMAGFALFWILFATALTARCRDRSTPLSLSWWSLVFPIGAITLGLSALAEAADSRTLEVVALCFYAVLIVVWTIIAARSIAGGHMFWWRAQKA